MKNPTKIIAVVSVLTIAVLSLRNCTNKEEKTTKTLRPLTARVIPTSSTKNGLKITGERK